MADRRELASRQITSPREGDRGMSTPQIDDYPEYNGEDDLEECYECCGLAIRSVNGEPCCESHYLREIRDSQVIVDDGEPQEISSPPPPSELCKLGCGKPKHRGRCSKAALIPGSPGIKIKSAEAEAPWASQTVARMEYFAGMRGCKKVDPMYSRLIELVRQTLADDKMAAKLLRVNPPGGTKATNFRNQLVTKFEKAKLCVWMFANARENHVVIGRYVSDSGTVLPLDGIAPRRSQKAKKEGKP